MLLERDDWRMLAVVWKSGLRYSGNCFFRVARFGEGGQIAWMDRGLGGIGRQSESVGNPIEFLGIVGSEKLGSF